MGHFTVARAFLHSLFAAFYASCKPAFIREMPLDENEIDLIGARGAIASSAGKLIRAVIKLKPDA